ncbi:hypothetical protein FA95DRAFT_212078 [Auriscalpium vulgare]|uniref:Uncharacterized protein n=1 Tax=Auriscalpium vulgare TaxID=40419 RepID=A0ACB8RL51_9AGAM|nr:hypothetical protein FA95DRAFT_212078 [Auriscalpium vulgare]
MGSQMERARIAIYHVCRHWRAIVHDFAALWTTIPLRSAPLTQLALTRSKAESLFIHIDIGLLEWPAYHNLARTKISYLPRTRALSLAVRRAHRNNSALACVHFVGFLEDLPMPALESFELRDYQIQDWRLPDNIFQGVIPRLRELHLSRTLSTTSCLLSAPLVIFNLTEGSISTPPPDGMESEDEDEDVRNTRHHYVYLKHALDDFSHLRELHLCSTFNAFPPYNPADEAMPAVRLPFLEILKIRADIPEVAHLLRIISVPAHVDLHLMCHTRLGLSHSGNPENLSKFKNVLSIVGDMLRAYVRTVAIAGLTFRHLNVRAVGRRSTMSKLGTDSFLAITESNPNPHVPFTYAPTTPRFRLTIMRPSGLFSFDEVLAILAHIPDVRSVEAFEALGINTPWGKDIADPGVAAKWVAALVPRRKHNSDDLLPAESPEPPSPHN